MKHKKKPTPAKVADVNNAAPVTLSKPDILLAIKTPLKASGVISPEQLETLASLFGSGGHAYTQLACDMRRHDEWSAQAADQLEKVRHALENRTVLKFEVISEAGLTNLNAPRVNSAQVRDEVLKDTRQQKLDGVLVTSPIIVRDPATDESMLITRARGCAILAADSNVTGEAMAGKLRADTSINSTLGIPVWRVKAIALSDLPAVVAWMSEVGTTPYIVDRRPGKSTALKPMVEGYSALEAARVLGHLCSHRVSETVTGIGPIGKSVVSRTQTKLISWHKGRRETGTVLPGNFDPWAFTVALERSIDAGCLPMRFDRPMTVLGITRPSKPRKLTGRQALNARRKRLKKDPRRPTKRKRAIVKSVK